MSDHHDLCCHADGEQLQQIGVVHAGHDVRLLEDLPAHVAARAFGRWGSNMPSCTHTQGPDKLKKSFMGTIAGIQKCFFFIMENLYPHRIEL